MKDGDCGSAHYHGNCNANESPVANDEDSDESEDDEFDIMVRNVTAKKRVVFCWPAFLLSFEERRGMGTWQQHLAGCRRSTVKPKNE